LTVGTLRFNKQRRRHHHPVMAVADRERLPARREKLGGGNYREARSLGACSAPFGLCTANFVAEALQVVAFVMDEQQPVSLTFVAVQAVLSAQAALSLPAQAFVSPA